MVQNELVNTKACSKQDLETVGYKIVISIDNSKQDLMFSTILTQVQRWGEKKLNAKGFSQNS